MPDNQPKPAEVCSVPTAAVGIAQDYLSEPVSEAYGRLRAMGNAIRSIQARKIVGWRVVDEAAIFSTHKHVMRYVEIGSAAVDKRGTRLRLSPVEVFRIKHQASRSRQHKPCEPAHRHTEDVRRGDFMGMTLHV